MTLCTFRLVVLTASLFPLQIRSYKMDIRVASILLLIVTLTAAHGERYVVKKVMKAAPQYQPYSVKSHGKRTQPPALYTASSLTMLAFLLFMSNLSSQTQPLQSGFPL